MASIGRTAPETRESRRLEFEQLSDTAQPGPQEISGYALYYVCEDQNGICYFLRQDFSINFTVDPNAPTLQ